MTRLVNVSGGEGFLTVSVSIAERIDAERHEAIRAQRRSPRTALQEAEPAKLLKIGHTPLRGATGRLIPDGSIEHQGSFCVVCQLSLEDVAKIYPIINVFEVLATDDRDQKELWPKSCRPT